MLIKRNFFCLFVLSALMMASATGVLKAQQPDKPSVKEPAIIIESPPAAEEDVVFVQVEQPPKFPGGMEAMMEYLQANLTYPPDARKDGIQGRVFVRFVVERDGTLSDITILRGAGGGLDEEAVRVVKGMPAWEPGLQRGEPVRVQFVLPIAFAL